MASVELLKRLFETASVSKQFAGMTDESIQKACLSHKDNTDDEVLRAINNIKAKDQRLKTESNEKQQKLEEGKEKMIALQRQEALDHKKDDRDAEKVLEELFN